jgi:hypothetical protein
MKPKIKRGSRTIATDYLRGVRTIKNRSSTDARLLTFEMLIERMKPKRGKKI